MDDLPWVLYAALATPIGLLLTWLGKLVGDLLKTKIKSELLSGMVSRFWDSIFATVRATNQRMPEIIGRARDPNSPGGTKITKEEAEKLEADAWQGFKDYWGPKGLKELTKVMGWDQPGQLENMFGNGVKTALDRLKDRSGNP